jgi:chemosensory pili system protein ChpC
MSEPSRELYSLLIPLKQERLLLPRMCVAEVIAFAEPEPPAADLPEWYLGTVDWNGRRLPVLALEPGAAAVESRGRRKTRTRIVVLHAISEALPGGYYGILTQGFPQLVRVNRDVLSCEPELGWLDPETMLCRVRMIHEYPLIPNLETLERRVAALRLKA